MTTVAHPETVTIPETTNEETIALALAAGAAVFLRPNNWAADRPEVDAYLALVELITGAYPNIDARMMEVGAASDQRRAYLAQQLAKTDAVENRAVLRQSRRLLELVATRVPGALAAVLAPEEYSSNH